MEVLWLSAQHSGPESSENYFPIIWQPVHLKWNSMASFLRGIHWNLCMSCSCSHLTMSLMFALIWKKWEKEIQLCSCNNMDPDGLITMKRPKLAVRGWFIWCVRTPREMTHAWTFSGDTKEASKNYALCSKQANEQKRKQKGNHCFRKRSPTYVWWQRSRSSLGPTGLPGVGVASHAYSASCS